MSPFSGTVALCMGTRPELIKMAPVFHALRQTALRPLVVHTGQHDDLAWPLYGFFGIRPHVALPLERHHTSLAPLNAQLLDALDGAFEHTRLDAVLVHGDTTIALAAAQAAFYRQIPVGHVEAGLRSGSRYDPFPEEMNRMLIGQMATWHFAPTEGAARNLRRENGDPEAVRVVGNTVVGNTVVNAAHLASYFAREDVEDRTSTVSLERVARRRRLVLVTAHRRENWDGPIEYIAAAVADLALRHDELAFVWPLHPNPRVRAAVHAVIDALPAVVRARAARRAGELPADALGAAPRVARDDRLGRPAGRSGFVRPAAPRAAQDDRTARGDRGGRRRARGHRPRRPDGVG